MPFALDWGGLAEPPPKRRKLLSPSAMTRYTVQAYHDPKDLPFERGQSSGECNGPHQEEFAENEDAPIMTSDREELIQCIKRGQRPTWVPKPGLEALCAEVDAEQKASSSKLLKAGSEIPRKDKLPAGLPTPLSATDALRRSLSALHTDDFRISTPQMTTKSADMSTPPRLTGHREYSTSPPLWHLESPPIPSSPPVGSYSDFRQRSRAPSLGSSLSSSFVMRIPTSPLVHATNNPTLDFSPRNSQPTETGKHARRRTVPPNAFESLPVSPIDGGMPNFSRPLLQPHSHREGSSYPLGHRPRRSLSSFTYQSATSPLVPPPSRQRRTSLAADVSPRQRASMVGSFEESILRGRMSTPASNPLDFVAQIGVLGKGNCPASLKCPAHVTVAFPAVFYNYPSANAFRSISDDNPSPYVGTIDLEHNLKPLEPPVRRSRPSQASLDPEALAAEITSPENTAIGRALARETRERKQRSSPSPKVPLGGAYRVPQKGQLQIIIKNPNKTAVKLFLVPYDLEGMPPGTKTFVRQRSFSSEPILEAAFLEKQSTLAARDPMRNKDILRYLIHLKFCSIAKGRYFLYDNIRVVFANRVPDDKEKLRNEVQLPEPRFSPYKPTPEPGSRSPSVAEESFSSQPEESPPTLFSLPTRSTFELHSNSGDSPWREEQKEVEADRTVSPTPGFVPSTSSRSSPVPWPTSNGSSTLRSFSPTVEAGHGLISRKLRELNGGIAGQQEQCHT